MRTKNALKNVIVSTFSYCFLLLVALLVRRLLLHNFDVELVAYDGLLSNIFSLMAIAELGTSGLFDYRMYQAFAKEDTKRIIKLISMFRAAYHLIGLMITLLCVLVYFFLPVIFSGKVHLWGYFRLMYVIYAISTVGTYYLGYWRTLLVSGQKEYKIVTIQTVLNTATQLAKLVILWTTKSYLLYLLITCATNLSTQLLSKLYAKREYPEVHIVPVTWEDFKKEDMFREMRESILIKLASSIMYSTDNLIILMLVSTAASAMYNNYCLIGSSVIALFFKLIQPMHATIANMINKESKETSYALFQTLDLWCFFLASIILVCFSVVFQPAITVLFGEQFLLPYSFVTVYALQNYVNTKKQSVAELRGAFGEYHVERFYDVLGMVLNITLSLILGHFWGIAGIVIGTIVALLGFWNGFAVIVIKHFYQKSLFTFWGRELLFLLLALIELGIAYLVTRQIPYTFFGIILRGMFGVMIPTICNILLFYRTEAFQGAIRRLQAALISRFKKEKN